MTDRTPLAFPAAILILPALVFAAGCQESNTFVEPPPPTVTVAPPEVRDVVHYVDFTGRTEAVETVEVRARLKGFLDEMYFEPSQMVEKGKLLFQIEPESFEAALAAAQADAAAAKAAYDLSIVTYDKAKAAYDKGAVTELELRQRSAERDAAKAYHDSTLAAVDNAKLDLSYTKIHAPVSGRISRDYVSVGNLVGSTEPTLLTTIVVDDPIYAYFNVDERFLLDYTRKVDRTAPPDPEEGANQVELQFADGADYPLKGYVDFGENRIDSATGTIQVRAVFDNPEAKLFPGMFVRVRFPRPFVDAMLVPELSLQRDLVGNFLLIVDSAGMVQRRDVELGPRIGPERVIVGGLQPADRVIVNGLQRARPGIPVKAVDRGAAAAPPPAGPESGQDGGE